MSVIYHILIINFTYRMKQLQHSVFLNLSRVSKYQERSRNLSEPRAHFAKFRDEEIRNQFELVDFNGSGKLSRERIESYLSEKYQKINIQLVDTLLATMRWDEQDEVTKQEFCTKYIQRQKLLYHDLNALASLKQRLATIRDVYEQTKAYVLISYTQKPKLYAKIKIAKLFIKSQRQGKENEEWIDIQIEYQDHKNKFNYLIEQPSYGTQQPSFQVLFPVQDNYFFVKYRFHSPKGKENLYGQCYVNVPIASNGNGKKNQRVIADVANSQNKKIGYCEFVIEFESDLKVVEQYIDEMEREQPTSYEKSQIMKKQYEYLQYLWGVRHKYPHKIAKIDVMWMVIVRIVLFSFLGIISIIVQVMGRCEPLSFMLSLIIAKNWKYVMLRSQKFLLVWIVIGGICLDLIWIAFDGDHLSQINYLKLAWCSVLTYLLIIVKIVLLLYMLIVQKAFSAEDDDNQDGS